VPYDQLNELFNKHEYFIHLPQNVDPFCRSVAEAYLAGCKLICNDNVGCLSYDWFKDRETVRKELKLAAKKFWFHVGGVIN